MSLANGLILMCLIAVIVSVGLVAFAIWIRNREEPILNRLIEELVRGAKECWTAFWSKGFFTGIVGGAMAYLALLQWPDQAFLDILVPTLLLVLVLSFWTGAIGIKIERK
jgi:hypothetical protein